MISKVRISCYFCHKPFLTKRAYFIFNKGAGYNSFCSKKCHYKSKLLGKTLSCENPECDKKFYRAPYGISTFNYCSKSCAAIVNNQKYPKWPTRYCTRKGCQNVIQRVGSLYCSIGCGKLGRFKYTKEEIVGIIQNYFKNNGNVPPKRGLAEISHKAIHQFGGWNNAIYAAGFSPNRSHDHRMYKRTKTKAQDGHLCDSVSEAIIDDWLSENKILHTRDVVCPSSKHRADWAILDGSVFVEYFGLANDSPRYDRAVKEKIRLCEKHKIRLIKIFPSDLYPESRLNTVFSHTQKYEKIVSI